MKTINLSEQPTDITQILELAQHGPIVILTSDGREYVVAESNDFDREVEELRNSVAFQTFLDERSTYKKGKRRISLDVIAQEIDAEIAAQHEPESEV